MKSMGKITALLIFILAVSLCAGVFFEVGMSGQSKENLSMLITTGSTEDDSFTTLLLSLLIRNIPAAAAAFIAPAVFVTLPVLPLFIMFEGLSAGFSAAMFFEIMGAKGISHVIITLLIYNVFRMPALCLLAAMSIMTASVNFRAAVSGRNPALKRSKKALHRNARPYALISAACTAIIIISCILEAFLLQLKL